MLFFGKAKSTRKNKNELKKLGKLIQSELFYSVFIHFKLQYVVLFVRSDFSDNPELNLKECPLL